MIRMTIDIVSNVCFVLAIVFAIIAMVSFINELLYIED